MANKFAEKLRQLREAARYSRRELAEASGVSEGAIRDYERSARSPSLEAAARLAYALNKSLAIWSECPDLKGAYRLPARDPRAGSLAFGSHKGKLLSEVPYDYLEWLVRSRVTRLTPLQSVEARRLLKERQHEEQEAARAAEAIARRAEAEVEKIEAENRLAEANEIKRRRQEALGANPDKPVKKTPQTCLDDALPWEKETPPTAAPGRRQPEQEAGDSEGQEKIE